MILKPTLARKSPIVWVNPFAALRTRFEFEAVGVKNSGTPPSRNWPDRQVVNMVLTVVVMLSRQQLSLTRAGAVTTT
jgi:hypothetical protein